MNKDIKDGERLNDAPILDQLDPYWQKIAGLLLWKLAKRDEIVLFKSKYMEQFNKDWPDGGIIFVHGMQDGFSFRLVTMEEANRLQEHHKTQRGSS